MLINSRISDSKANLRKRHQHFLNDRTSYFDMYVDKLLIHDLHLTAEDDTSMGWVIGNVDREWPLNDQTNIVIEESTFSPKDITLLGAVRMKNVYVTLPLFLLCLNIKMNFDRIVPYSFQFNIRIWECIKRLSEL